MLCLPIEILCLPRNSKFRRGKFCLPAEYNNEIKKGVQALMFGMNSKKWRRGQGIPDNIRSPSLDRLEREIKEARMLITDDEGGQS